MPDGETAECARGEWCPGAWRDNAGGWHGGACYRVLCVPDERHLDARLGELPGLYAELLAELRRLGGSPGRHAPGFTAGVNIRQDADAVLREMTDVCCSWEQRVREVARLSAGRVVHRRDGLRDLDAAFSRAVDVLARHQATLLALRPEPVTRYIPDTPGRVEASGGVVIGRCPGYVTVRVVLSGADAGNEIFRLHHRARRVLGQVSPRPDELLGVACYECGLRCLYRAGPPRYEGGTVFYSRCAGCGHLMTEPEYRIHTGRLAAMAQRAAERLE